MHGYPFHAPTKELTDGSLTAGSGWRVNEELSGVIHLDAVKLRDGREYGPLEVGYYRSQPVTYPLDIPFFKHLCENDHLVPANFEDRSEQTPLSGRRDYLPTRASDTRRHSPDYCLSNGSTQNEADACME